MAEAHDELPSREATLFAVDRTYRIAVIGMLITVLLWIGSREADLLYGDTYDNMRVGFYEGLFIVSWRESSGGTQTGWGRLHVHRFA